MNLDQVLNSIEDKDITEIRNSLESQLSQRVEQQTNFQSASVANNGIFTSNSNDFSSSSRISSNSTANSINNNNSITTTHPSGSSSGGYLQKSTNLLNGGGMQANESNNNNSKTFILNSSGGGSNNSQHILVTASSTAGSMPTNEPVKLVYPVSGTQTATSGGMVTTSKSFACLRSPPFPS